MFFKENFSRDNCKTIVDVIRGELGMVITPVNSESAVKLFEELEDRLN